jgi:hypothetical protein
MICIAAAAVLPCAVWGIPNGADLPNHLRFVVPFYESLQAGILHPAWLAESNYGLGDLRFTVYPPGLYYLLSAVRWVTGTWFLAMIATFGLLSITGSLGAWLWARTILNSKLAVWVGIFYALAPYRLNELYQASLLSEFAAGSILPFAFAFVERICRRKSPYDILGLGASYALMILMHLPIAVIGSVALAAYALARVYFAAGSELTRDNTNRSTVRLFQCYGQMLRVLGRLALGAFLGLAASSFFWTSMIAELPWIKANAKEPNPYYDYRLNFLFSAEALTNRNTWYANLLGLVIIGFVLPGLVLIKPSSRKRRTRPAMKTTVVVLCGTFLMTTAASRPIWAVVPKLSEIQFPWRWLSVVSLMSALLLGASIHRWKTQLVKWRPRDFAIGLAFILAVVFISSQIVWDCEYLGRGKFETLASEVRGAVSFKDFLPVWARDFKEVRKMNAPVEAGSRQIAVNSWEPEHRSFHVDAGSQTSLQVRTYFYPHWVARITGRPLPATATPDGLLQLSIPATASDIELNFERPARVRLFEIVSLFSWVLIICGFVFLTIGAGSISRPPQGNPSRL